MQRTTQNSWFARRGIENGKLFAASLHQVADIGHMCMEHTHTHTCFFIPLFCTSDQCLLIQLKRSTLGVAWSYNDLVLFIFLLLLLDLIRNRGVLVISHARHCDKNGNTYLNGNNINLTTITIRWLNMLKRSNLLGWAIACNHDVGCAIQYDTIITSESLMDVFSARPQQQQQQ